MRAETNAVSWRMLRLKTGQFLVTFLAFCLCNEIGNHFLVENEVSIFYPATAVDVLAVMHFGWIGALAVILGNIATPWDPTYSVSFLAFGGILNALYGAIPAIVFRWSRKLHSDLRDLRSFGAFLLFGTVINSAVFSILGNLLLLPRPPDGYDLRPFVIWWVADFSGTLLIATPLLAWGGRAFDLLRGRKEARPPRTLTNALEVTAVIILLGWIASTAIRTNIVESFERDRIVEQQTWARAGRLMTIMHRNLLEAIITADSTDVAHLRAARERHQHFLTSVRREAESFPPEIREVLESAAIQTQTWFGAASRGDVTSTLKQAVSGSMLQLRTALDTANEQRWAEFAEQRERIKLVAFMLDLLLFGIIGLAVTDLVIGLSRPLAQMHQGISEMKNGAAFDARHFDAPFVELRAMAETIDETSRALREHEAELRVQTDRAIMASRHKTDFLAKMSHELRTPLNSILGFAELLIDREEDLDRARRRQFLDNIFRSGSNLLRMINDLLDIAKIESGKLTLRYEDVDLRQVVRNSVVTTMPLFERKKQKVEVALPQDALVMNADAQRMEQAVLNLLSNANKYSGEGAKVIVKAGALDEVFEIEVSDTGYGIPLEHQERIFDDFEQLNVSGGHVGGTGLGLALARRFVEAHGGKIMLESSPGRGSTFRIVLPRGDSAGQ